MPCRLLIDPPADGAWNMAVDEVLLEDVTTVGVPVLRFYRWSRPTLSLGYFQNVADRSAHAASAEADLVRRLSGGGAILHDQELTYSLVLPASHELASDTQSLYDGIHEAILAEIADIVGKWNSLWEPQLCDPATLPTVHQDSFLCFQRRCTGDILLSQSGASGSINHKVVGSAQRRRRGTVLQHGSILLRRSPAAPELSGIVEITQSEVSAAQLVERLPSKMAAAARLEPKQVKLSDELADRSRQRQQSKYLQSEWTQRR